MICNSTCLHEKQKIKLFKRTESVLEGNKIIQAADTLYLPPTTSLIFSMTL